MSISTRCVRANKKQSSKKCITCARAFVRLHHCNMKQQKRIKLNDEDLVIKSDMPRGDPLNYERQG